MIEPQYLVVLDSAPESEPDGPWAADVVVDTYGVETDKTARWLVTDYYTEVLPDESPFGAHSYLFRPDDDTFVYVQECDVSEILLLSEVVN